MRGFNHSSRRDVIAGSSVILASLSSGCTDMLEEPPVGQVQVRLADIRTPDAGVTSLTPPLVLEFYNTANAPVPELTSRSTVHINGNRAANADADVGTLDAGQRRRVRFDMIIYYAEVGDAVLDALGRGEFSITVRGNMEAERFMFLDASRDFQISAEIG